MRRIRWLATIAAFLAPAKAGAHTTFPGLGEIASGALHPFCAPSQVLLLLALGILLGQRRPFRIGWPAAVFAGAAGIGIGFAGNELYLPILLGVALLLAATAAIAAPLPPWAALLACGAAGLALGLDSGAATVKILLSTWASLTLCAVNVAFYVSLLPGSRWAQTGLRVISSWIVAISLLLLAFAVAHGRIL